MTSAGSEMVRRVVAEMAEHGLTPDGREVELLAMAEKLADRLDRLERLIEADGMCYVSPTGIAHMNPAVSEARQTASALARLLSGIQMEDPTTKNRAKQTAARARWREHNTARQQHG